MSNGTKVAIIIVVVVIALICAISVMMIGREKHKQALSEQIEDRNGDDKELCVITDDVISQCEKNYTAIRHHVFSGGLNHSGVKGAYKDCDNEYRHTKIGMLSGIYISNAFLGHGIEVTYTITSSVEDGNLKIVITDETNAILYDVPIDQTAKISFIAETGRLYYVKFVGESAKLDVELWCEEGDL